MLRRVMNPILNAEEVVKEDFACTLLTAPVIQTLRAN